MSSKTRNPNIDYGFHMVIPRLVRTEYKDVSCTQKWLYTCLKDLCGDTGTCYRTLRVLSEETGMSTGMLSESIPALHKAGLIHAEKKRRSTGGKEVWHITIVDIWQANAKAHPTKRSQNEQTKTDENVQDMNVHIVNEATGECSCGERECSQIRHRSTNTLSTNITEELTEDTIPAPAFAAHPSPSSENNSHSQSTPTKQLSTSVDKQGGANGQSEGNRTPNRSSTTTQASSLSAARAGGTQSESATHRMSNNGALAVSPDHLPDMANRHNYPLQDHSRSSGDRSHLGNHMGNPVRPAHQQEITPQAQTCAEPSPDAENAPSRGETSDDSTPAQKNALRSTERARNGIVEDKTSPTQHNGELTSPQGDKQAAVHIAQEDTGKRPSAKVAPSGPPQAPPADMPWGTRKCLLKLDAWRGGPFLVDWQLKKASKTAKSLAETYTEAQFDAVHTAMNADPYYQERGGADLFDVATHFAKYLRRIEKGLPTPPPTKNQQVARNTNRVISSFDDPNYRMEDEFYPSEAERRAHARLGA